MFELGFHVDEANKRIVLHAANSLKYNIFPLSNTVIYSNYGSKVVLVMPIYAMVSNLGTICTLLPAIHKLTRNNYTSNIRTKSAALKANPEKFRIAFTNIFMSQTLAKSEAYLVQVFKKCVTVSFVLSQQRNQ